MIDTWHQIEFFSDEEHRWVPLFGKFGADPAGEQEARQKSKELLPNAPRRVVLVSMNKKVIESNRP